VPRVLALTLALALALTLAPALELQDHKSKLHKYKTQLQKLQNLQGSLQGGPPGGFDVAPSAASLVGMASAVAEAEAHTWSRA
jgi:hypothetical protein